MAVIASERGRAPPTAPEQEFSTEGLPRAFLQSLRTLFDILDDRRRGYVHLLEIESRWQGADTRELPRGVLEGLRKVAPASGYLTFERFVVGLRTSLLSAENGAPHARAPQGSRGQASQAKVLPMGPGICKASSGQGRGKLVHEKHHQRLIFAPADEPRTMLEKKPLSLGIRYPHAGSSCSSRSLEKLSSPQEAGCYPGDLERPKSQAPQSPGGLVLERSQSGDAGTDVWTVGRCHSENCTAGGSGRHPRGRGEQRRHTITSGVDYDMSKSKRQNGGGRNVFPRPPALEWLQDYSRYSGSGLEASLRTLYLFLIWKIHSSKDIRAEADEGAGTGEGCTPARAGNDGQGKGLVLPTAPVGTGATAPPR
ncbi:suppressor APC domain-containing protein 2 isoform X2 [Phascolarctos cinereus]